MTAYIGTYPGEHALSLYIYIFIVAESASHPSKSRWLNSPAFPGNKA